MLPTIVLVNAAVALIGVSLAFGLKRPGIFMKTQNGRLSPLSYVIFWPYFVFNTINLGMYRLLSKEHPIDEIIPGLYLGRRLWSIEKEQLLQRNICAVVDATSEWKEAKYIREHCDYLGVPVLDACPPTLVQLHEAMTWIAKQLKHGGVFVHCALGHGRSATIVAAYLLYAKKVTDVQEALDFIKQKRSKIRLHAGQISILHEYRQCIT